jgi:NitT/TauT family transport system permease protein
MTTALKTRPTRGRISAGDSRSGTWFITVGTLALFAAVWEVIPRLDVVDRTLFPTLTDTLAGLMRLVSAGYWWTDVTATLTSVVVAWLIGCSFGFIIGIALGTTPFIRTAITPYAIAVQALPKIVLAPLFIGWLGFGPQSKIAIAVVICFFPVWIDTMVGLALPSANEFKLMQSLNATRAQTFWKLQLPSAVPMIAVGVKHAMLLSFTGVLVAEILSASAGGLGTLAEEFSHQLNMPLTFAVVIVVVLIAITLVSIMDFIERRVVFWSEESRSRKS